MQFQPLKIEGGFLIRTTPRADERGTFARVFCSREFGEHGLPGNFVQANQSQTVHAGTVRGLHYQLAPFAEGKLVRCLRGSIQDVMVDVRHGSKTLLYWYSEVLTESNGLLLYVPPGCAHGFLTLEDNTVVTYQSTAFYSSENERQIRYSDPLVAIDWKIEPTHFSEKDASTAFLPTSFEGVIL